MEDNTYIYNNDRSQIAREKIENTIGQGTEIRKLLDRVEQYKDLKYPILFQGPPGARNRLFARYIHSLSLRSNEKYCVIHCGTFDDSAIGTELFGWVKGAFTSAHRTRIGLIESADKGTLVLDRIDRLSVCSQIRVLSLLEEQTIL